MPNKISKQARVWWCTPVGLGVLLIGRQADDEFIRGLCLKEPEEAVLPSAFSQENLGLKPRMFLTRIQREGGRSDGGGLYRA